MDRDINNFLARVSEANEGQKVVNIEIHFEKSLLPLANSIFGRVFYQNR